MSEAAVADRPELAELWEGLTQEQKHVSSRYFYDQRGSELFERITRLEAYYPTRTERTLLERWADPIVARIRPRTLLELGAGSAQKTRILLDTMSRQVPGACYMPVDVSGEFLNRTATELRREYPDLQIVPEVADFTASFEVRHGMEKPAIFALLGSTIGNFTDPAALRIIRAVTRWMGPSDHFLLGVDLRPGPGKTVEELELAYDDDEGVTAEFNLNLLRVLNDTFGTDFDPSDFEHRAMWVESESRIEMHLAARRPLSVSVPDRGRVLFEAGESLRTEISCKYDRARIQAMFARAGLRMTDWLDAGGRYALALGRTAAGGP